MSVQYGTCPVCNGTGKRDFTEEEKRYSWNKDKEQGECRNCGGETMSLKGTGRVRLDKEGNPCKHLYKGRSAGRCYTEYSCSKCGDRYAIDSGD